MTWEHFINEHDPYLCQWFGCNRGQYGGTVFCQRHYYQAVLSIWWRSCTFPFVAIFVGVLYLFFLVFRIRIQRKVEE